MIHFRFILILILIPFVLSGPKHFLDDLGKNCSADKVEEQCGPALVCRDGICSLCLNNTECINRRVTLDCKPIRDLKGTKVNVCRHKDLFPRITWHDIGATVTTFLASSMAAATGIGGGALFIPMFHLIGGLPTSMTVPLAKAMIVGESICTVLIYSFLRHPYADRPLINFELAGIFLPLTLIGTIGGVYLNTIFPNWVITLLITLSLSAICIRTFYNGVTTWKQETLRMEGKLTDADDIQHSLLVDQESLTEKQKKQLAEIVESERHVSWGYIFLIFLCWIIIVISSYLKGGRQAPSPLGIIPCSINYWIFVALPVPIIVFIVSCMIVYIMQRYHLKKSLGYQFVRGDIAWTFKNAILYPILCFFSGLCSAFLGIGGGTMKTPLMYEMGVIPQIVTATSGFMILPTASISAFQFWVLGKLQFDYGLWFLLNGFFSAALGHLVVIYIVRKTGRQSFIMFILAIVLVFSVGFMTGFGIYDFVRDWNSGKYMGLNNPC